MAAGTFVLALSTRQAAKASAEDVRTQWRPAIVPGISADVEFEDDFEVVVIAVRNVGRGAACYVDAALGVGESYWPAHDAAPGRETENFAVVPAGAELHLCFDCTEDRPSTAEVLIDYTDLTGRPYSTRIELSNINVASVLRMAKVELSDNRERIPWKPWTWELSTRKEWLRSKLRKKERAEEF